MDWPKEGDGESGIGLLSSPLSTFKLQSQVLQVDTDWQKLEVDLTLKRSSQLQSGFIQVQMVVQLLLQGFNVTPFAIEDV